jgi:hypothetical protein
MARTGRVATLLSSDAEAYQYRRNVIDPFAAYDPSGWSTRSCPSMGMSVRLLPMSLLVRMGG